MKISAGGGFGKTSQGDERRREKKKNYRGQKKDTLGSIVVERNAREKRERDGLGGGPRPRPDKLRSLDLSLSIEIGLK